MKETLDFTDGGQKMIAVENGMKSRAPSTAIRRVSNYRNSIAVARAPKMRAERGAALLAALCFASVLALALGSYITVCYRTLDLSSRAVQGTRSVELAEMGMEEALWALNKNDWDGWTISGSNASKSIAGVTYGDGSSGSVSLQVTNYNGSSGNRTVTVTGTTEEPDGTVFNRTLSSTSTRAPLFVNAVAATTGRVKFQAGGSVDSYNSAAGLYSAQTPGYAAIVSSGSTGTSSATVQLTNAEIRGYVATLGTGASFSSGGRLLGPNTSANTKIDISRLSTSPYQPLFDEVYPSGAGTTLPGGTATIGTSGASTASLYYATNINLDNSEVLTVNGPVVIAVSGNLSISDSAKIVISSTGSLRIHVSGDISIGGNGIQNDTKLPKKLSIISTSSPYESYRMATNTAFYGVIFTPVSSLTVANSQTIYGAIVAKAVTFSGSPVIHYDVALRNETFDGFETPFAISNLRELTGL